ncbi:hypothetical protein L6261_02455 [Candidatus Parcubacteria bacterium]|nr:hypothetical protein [Candidatus Parcubacteria bacterium]
MPFNILIHDDISLAELIKINKEGGRVLKTPHIGNIYPNNLAIISLGIPTLLYDRNVGSKDKNFHPHKIIFEGKSELISDSNILSTHSKIKYISKNFEIERDIVGTNLVNFHLESLNKVLPAGNCFTYSDYLRENKDSIYRVIKEVTKTFPEIWSRFVDKDGVVTNKKTNKSNIFDDGVYGVNNKEKGWLIPNPVNILLHGVIDTINLKTSEIYLLSGPDMCSYIKNYEDVLNSMFDHLKKTLELELPDSVNCHIIPVANMRFVATKGYIKSLEKLIVMYKEYEKADETIQSLLGNFSKSLKIPSLINEKNKIKKMIFDHLSYNYVYFKKMIFYDISESNCFTQYDLSKTSGLYVHPWALENDLKDVSAAFLFLDRIFKTIKKEDD